ncbi:MAG: helix-turn-helix transcriptional regulator [Lachnospiraceae bacterium]|nr:helix-turn-helix transcriptional regulator [Lachnospiraceae bacterium]
MYDEKESIRKLGDNLRVLRELTGMSQVAFARSIFIARSSYSDYERGLRFPDMSLLLLICDRYGVNLNTMLFGTRGQVEAEYLNEEKVAEKAALIQDIYDFLQQK